MSKYLLIALSYLLSTINGAPCIPANTCFPYAMRPTAAAISSIKFTCSSGKVTQNLYFGSSDCSGSPQSVNELGNYDLASMNVLADGSGSGTLTTNLIQGTDCPVLTSSSSSCTEYMYVKKYGNKNYKDSDGVSQAYGDIGDDCVNKGNVWDGFLLPVGCADLSFVGRQVFSCSLTANPNTFAFDFYSGKCPSGGEFKTAQSESYTANECGLFSERTHCGGNSQSSPTICSTGGVLVEYPYYIEVACCGNCDLDSLADTPTKEPTRATPGPTTANPTDVNGTGRPTTPAPTAIPAKGVSSGVNQLEYFMSMMFVMIGLLLY